MSQFFVGIGYYKCTVLILPSWNCASHLMDRTEFMLLYSIHIDDEDHLNVVTQVAEQTMTFDSRLDVQ